MTENAGRFKAFLKTKLVTLIAIWVVLIALFTVWAAVQDGDYTKFLSPTVLLEIGNQLVLTLFLSVGAALLLVSGNLDLSASAIGAFSSILVAAAMKFWGVPPAFAIILTIVAATLLGAFNAVLVNEFRIQPFIATMAMATVIRGICQWISVEPGKVQPGPIILSKNPVIKFIADGKLFDLIPYTLILAIVAIIIYGLILAKTKFGMQIYMVGGNPQAARLSGISPRKTYYALFANTGFCAGICGVIVAGRLGQGNGLALSNNQFTGLTAAILGGISFGGGAGNMAGVFMGVLILATFDKGTTVVRFSSYLTTAFTGLLLLIALAYDYFSARSASKAVGLIKPAKRAKKLS